ncbi:hypothetical protein FJT64_020480 [Amphibalanus amphitrite]|uniref:Uncharacterized protein n=1 Tax=Amphibalanus amphitrite TaxID=1232801 RepID=A0A6A4WSL9_AMPAM|nr:hypothetical protein FJT64_020480 [Amphibalanus amphitrite]
MSVNNEQHPASNGNDGLQGTVVRSKTLTQLANLTWTVDLGQLVQVTSVLYMAGSSSDLTTNCNHLTEIRVGSDRTSFDEQHSARCVWLEAPFVAAGHARLFPVHCAGDGPVRAPDPPPAGDDAGVR